jgi:hypothetical protein
MHSWGPDDALNCADSNWGVIQLRDVNNPLQPGHIEIANGIVHAGCSAGDQANPVAGAASFT